MIENPPNELSTRSLLGKVLFCYVAKSQPRGIGLKKQSAFIMSRLLHIGFLVVLVTSIAAGQEDSLSARDLKRMSLEDLMDIEIITASKKAEPLFAVPSAVHVITNEDIRRSGLTTLPEVLQLSPKLHVAQVDSRQWAISARGFNGTTSNKLLVMIDGRVVYTPLYSGVFWDVQNLFLDDVERIEVISGPGGTLWGANAVNGVINVITKKSSNASSQGTKVYAGLGTEEPWMAGARYGGKLGERGWFRIYGMGFTKREARRVGGSGASDDWMMTQAGFRSDWDLPSGDLTVQGDLYSGTFNQQAPDDAEARGGNLLARYALEINDVSNIEIRGYGDVTHRRIPGTFGEDLGTFDIEAQHSVTLGHHQIVWGAGFRHYNDRVINSAALAFLPARLKHDLLTAFVQDEFAIIPKTLRLTIGSKFERNYYTGFEVQPSVRISWMASQTMFVWAAVSRAVRTPSRIDRDFHIPGDPPHAFLAGGPDFISESVIAFEMGSRFSSPMTTIDVAVFYNTYDDLRTYEPSVPPVLRNGLAASSYGTEIDVNHSIADWWRLEAGYALFNKEPRLKEWSNDVNVGQGEGNDARHRFKVRSLMDLTPFLQLDAWVRYVDRLPNANAIVPAYVTADVRLGFQVSNHVSVSLLGRHLVETSHPEFGSPSTRKEVRRQVSIKAGVTL